VADKCADWNDYDKGACFEDPCEQWSTQCVEMGHYADRVSYPNAFGVYYIKTFPQPDGVSTDLCGRRVRYRKSL
jgi:hypothetical protein